MESFLRTATGKMRKVDLVNAVQDKKPDQGKEIVAQSTQDVLIQIWQRVLGTENGEVHADTLVLQIADSLEILRFCYHAEQEVGSRITAANVLEHETPRHQADYLKQKSGSSWGSRQPVQDGQLSIVPSPDESWITDDMRQSVSSSSSSPFRS